jgi:hypothetical protein
LDARLRWRIADRKELSIEAQNLFDPRHPKFDGLARCVEGTEPKCCVFGKLSYGV